MCFVWTLARKMQVLRFTIKSIDLAHARTCADKRPPAFRPPFKPVQYQALYSYLNLRRLSNFSQKAENGSKFARGTVVLPLSCESPVALIFKPATTLSLCGWINVHVTDLLKMQTTDQVSVCLTSDWRHLTVENKRTKSSWKVTWVINVPCDDNNTIRKCLLVFKKLPAIFLLDQLHQRVVLASYDQFFDTLYRRAVKQKHKRK